MAANAWLRAQGDAPHRRNASESRKNSGDERYGQVDADRTIVTVQDWLLPVPPQFAVSVEVAWFQEPMQPVRETVPKIRFAPLNEPSICNIAPPLTAPVPPPATTDLKWAKQTWFVPAMHCGALVLRSPHPAPVVISIE